MLEKAVLLEYPTYPVEKEIMVHGIRYKLTYEDGQPVLTTFDQEFKIWVELRFAKDGSNDQHILKNISQLILEMFVG
ncbi:MAG: hypothetical protein ABSA18_07855 [Dehalococcoidia bacterium]|jgi:hypothetical protein